MRHFDMQLIGGMALHNGKIAEMRTGEGKTLVATLPIYLNALAGTGVHLVTVNDYLAQRDADWMGRIYRFLGLTVGVNLSQMDHAAKQAAYASDITYGTNNEFGFDYLRDNMVFEARQRVQRGLHYAIVDEVDSILIDEARTPLIISGQADDNVDLYHRLNDIAPKLERQKDEKGEGDYWVDEKAHQVLLSEQGHEHAEQVLSGAGLLAPGRASTTRTTSGSCITCTRALRAHALFHRDQHYVVQNGEVVIVDEFTGRLMSGRRWSDGLHQAVEAKEGVSIQRENQTLASITFQNYFRMYGKLAGMTGTADTEAFEFQQIYHLETIVIPTHMTMVRKDENDQVFRTLAGEGRRDRRRHQGLPRARAAGAGRHDVDRKFRDAVRASRQGRAAARGAEREAARARGRDRRSGGSPERRSRSRPTWRAAAPTSCWAARSSRQILTLREDPALRARPRRNSQIGKLRSEWQVRHDAVIAAGGLHIVGTERHESRRIDNQLRGRAGRQGDPGSVALLPVARGSAAAHFRRRAPWVDHAALKMPDGEPIEHPIVNRSIAKAQNRVESRNFDIRKQLLEYDDVANDQRRVIYQQRNELLESTDIADTIRNMIAGSDRRVR